MKARESPPFVPDRIKLGLRDIEIEIGKRHFCGPAELTRMDLFLMGILLKFQRRPHPQNPTIAQGSPRPSECDSGDAAKTQADRESNEAIGRRQ